MLNKIRYDKIRYALGLTFLTLPVFSSAQEQNTGTNYSGSMGSVTVGQEQFYRLSIRPDIPIGRWGVALDIELFIEDSGNFSARGWKFGSTTEILDSALRKLYYVRYGRPDDATFFKVGALDQVTLGYGLIMADYRNTLQYPGIKKTGIQFRFANLGGSGFGIEGMLNNVQDFQEGGALLGIRAFGRAIGKLELGVTWVKDLDQYSGLRDSDGDGVPDEVDEFPDDTLSWLDNDRDGIEDFDDIDDDNDGIIDIDNNSDLDPEISKVLEDGLPKSLLDFDVTRRKAFNKNLAGRDSFSMLGFDAGYPLIESKSLNLKLYGQFAMLSDDEDARPDSVAKAEGVFTGNRKAEGFGIAAPGLWIDLGPLNGQFEFRHFRDDFDARYFDELYEVDRAFLDAATGQARPKDAKLIRGEDLSGAFGRLGAKLGDYLYASASYQYLTGANDPKQQLIGAASLSQNLLEQIPRLTRARAYYQKNNIGTRLNEAGEENSKDGFLEPTEDTFYGYDIGLEMAGGVSILWDTRFLFVRGANQELKRQKIMTIETAFQF